MACGDLCRAAAIVTGERPLAVIRAKGARRQPALRLVAAFGGFVFLAALARFSAGGR